MAVEQLDELGKVGQRAGQAVDLVDDDDIDLASFHVGQEPLQGWTLGRAAGSAVTPGAGPPTDSTAGDDAIDPMLVDLLRAQIKAELLAHHGSEESADRVLLPMGRADDGANRCSLRPAQHRQHASLLRACPALARRASLGLSQLLFPTSGPLCRSRLPLGASDLAAGDSTSTPSGAAPMLVSGAAPTASS